MKPFCTILDTDDDPRIHVHRSGKSTVALSTMRGEKYRSENAVNQDRTAFAEFSGAGGEEMLVDLVCDGLGGYSHGDTAAQLFCESLCELVETEGKKYCPLEDCIETLKDEVIQRTLEKYKKHLLDAESGTAFVMAITARDQVYFFHEGDCRGFLFNSRGELLFKTVDHKPREFEHRFKLTRYVSLSQANQFQSQNEIPPYSTLELGQEYILILVSDGITDNLKTSVHQPECETFLTQLLKTHRDAENLCMAIIASAHKRMALTGERYKELDVKPDNATCLVRWFKL